MRPARPSYGGSVERAGIDDDGKWHWYENLRDGIGRVEWKPKRVMLK